MEFAPENFPLYQLMQEYKFPGSDVAKKDFEAAQKGGAAEKYEFAMGLYTVTAVPEISKKVPVFTPAVIEKTRASVFGVFASGAEQGNADSALMAAFMKATGQGTPEDQRGAQALVAQAESIAGETPFSKKLREQLAPTRIIIPPKPGNLG